MVLSLVLVLGQAAQGDQLKRLEEASNAGDLGAVEEILTAHPEFAEARTEAGVSFLLNALYRQRAEVVQAYARRRKSFDIFEASSLGKADLLRSLLDKDPGAVTAVSSDGFFPLGLAAFFARSEAVALLLDRGADVNQWARSPRVQALHAAAAGRCVDCVRVLLEKGADPNAAQEQGFRALHEAASSNDRVMAELLIAKGAQPDIRNDKGKTSADLARDKGHAEMAAWLDSLGR